MACRLNYLERLRKKKAKAPVPPQRRFFNWSGSRDRSKEGRRISIFKRHIVVSTGQRDLKAIILLAFFY